MPCGRMPGPLCHRLEEWWRHNRPLLQWQEHEAVDNPPKDPSAGDQRVVPGTKLLPNLLVALDRLDNLTTLRAKGDRATVNVDNVNLKGGDRTGTPPGKPTLPGNRADLLTIRNLQVTGDASDGMLSGIGTLSVTNPSDPAHLTTPLDIDFKLNTTKLIVSTQGVSQGVQGSGSMLGGAVTANFTARFSYDSDRFKRALQGKLSAPDLAPSLDVSGALDVAVFKKIPFLKNIFRTKFELNAPTTAPVRRPLSGSLFAFPSTYKFTGIVPVPAGGLFDVHAAGFGVHRGGFDAKSGSSLTLSVTPVPLPPFPVYLYADYYRAMKVSDGVEVGVRLTVALDKADLSKFFGNAGDLFTGAVPPGGIDDPVQLKYKHAAHRPWEPDSRYNAGADYKKPWLMGRLVVRWW
jgi:hypothetical protein